jgi:hypothetical protein
MKSTFDGQVALLQESSRLDVLREAHKAVRTMFAVQTKGRD